MHDNKINKKAHSTTHTNLLVQQVGKQCRRHIISLNSIPDFYDNKVKRGMEKVYMFFKGVYSRPPITKLLYYVNLLKT